MILLSQGRILWLRVIVLLGAIIVTAALHPQMAYGVPSNAHERRAAMDALTQRGVAFEPNKFMMAAWQGQREVVELFLRAGMPPDAAQGERTALDAAAQTGRIEIVKLLLQQGAGTKNLPHKPYTSLSTALTYACNGGYREIVTLLIERGADVNAPVWVRALGWAAQGGHLEIAETLVRQGADINAKHIDGRTAFHLAVNKGHTPMIRFLLDRGAIQTTVPKESSIFSGYSALMVAAYHGHVDAGRFLIERGQDVNARDPKGDTALLITVAQGKSEMARMLLEKGAEIRIRNKGGVTPLQAATANGNPDMIALLRAKGAETDIGLELVQAVSGSDTKAVAELLKKGANPDFVAGSQFGRKGLPPLVTAVERNNNEIVTVLLEGGADPNLADDYAMTPLKKAAETGKLELIKLLLAKGARIDFIAEERTEAIYATPLFYAADSGHLDVVQFLVGKGANINSMSYDNVEGSRGTPLMRAVWREHIEVAKFLLAKGASLNEKDYQGQTALTYARRKGNAELQQLLQQAGGKEFPAEMW